MNDKDGTALEIKMFGVLDIRYKDRSIFLETAGNNKPLTLLSFMLTQRDKVFVAETLAESVWPGNEYVDEIKVIRTYIHRIRKILSSENVFQRDFTSDINIVNIMGNYKIALSGNVNLDIVDFERLYEASQAETDPDAILKNYNLLTRFYRGEFLEANRFDYWVIVLRNQYMRMFSAVTDTVLKSLAEHGRYKQALEVCDGALRICQLDETINIHYMRALLNSGDVNGALKHYAYITSKIYNELSIAPSARMLEIYNLLKSERKNRPLETDLGVISTAENQNLWLIINDVVKQHFAGDKNNFSVGCIKIVKSHSAEEAPSGADISEAYSKVSNALKGSLENALRKNDMYAIIDDRMAIVVLYDAKEEYFNGICSRISEEFYMRMASHDIRLHMKIFPVTTIR